MKRRAGARTVMLLGATCAVTVGVVRAHVAQAQTPVPMPATTMPATAAVASVQDSTHALSLADAVRLGERQSKALRIARNAVTRASGQQYQARSGLFPQLNASANYSRTLQSQFAGAFGGGSTTTTTPTTPAPAGPCDQYLLTPTSPTPDRVTGLEQYARCATGSSATGGIDFSQVGFGAANAYTLGLSGTQNLFTGGRLGGQIQSASAGRRAADIEVDAQRAQVTLDVTQGYYDAALADRLLAIADSALSQAEAQLGQTKLQQQVGNTSEFELLRATVARDNQRPVVIQRQSDREVAYLRLKQLLDLPLDAPLQLSTSIEDSTAVPPGVDIAKAAAPDTATALRAPVREADENVTAQRGLLRVAKAQRLPSLQLSSQYARLAYPNDVVPSWNAFRPNWTVSLATSVPLFTGGRIRGDILVAEANVRDAADRSAQTRQVAALDTRVALNTLRQAEASLSASAGTASQAQRAYQIADVRYHEGISTQLELNDARNQLQQSLANRAQASRDVLVARVRLALLPRLPLQTSGAGQSAAAQQQSVVAQQQQQAQQAAQQAAQAQQAQAQQSQQTTGVAVPGGSF